MKTAACYDYARQCWTNDSALALEQLKEELATLAGKDGNKYHEFTRDRNSNATRLDRVVALCKQINAIERA